MIQLTRLTLGFLTATSFLFNNSSLAAEIIAPAKYHGHFQTTRWNQKVFHLGPYHLFVNQDAAKQLHKYVRKPVAIDVSKVSQPINPGAGLIQEISNIKPASENKLSLQIKIKKDKVNPGKGIELQLKVENKTDQPITIRPQQLAVVLVTNSPFTNKQINFKDPDDRSYWYYSYAYHAIDDQEDHYRIACREIIVPWSARQMATRSSNIYPVNKDSFEDDSAIVFMPHSQYESSLTVGQKLLPDDYEVFFYLKTGNLSSLPGPMSKRLPFDVNW